jgi:hypothetical protein
MSDRKRRLVPERGFINETTSENSAVCPWCLHEHSACWEWFDDCGETECGSCGKPFIYDTETLRTFTCKRLVTPLEDE